jgi:tetratricopeptide (TPR) repeat protein
VGKDEQAHAYCQKVKSHLNKPAYLIFIITFIISGCGYLPINILLMKDPLTAEEHNDLGVAYENEGKYELAIREYKMALNKNHELIVPLVNIGNVFLKQENYSEAEKYYQRALKMNPYNLEAANNLASLYLIVGKEYQTALMNLTSAVAFNDGFPAYAMDTMGVLYYRLGNVEKAIFFLTKACENAKDDNELVQEIDNHLKDLGEIGCKKE